MVPVALAAHQSVVWARLNHFPQAAWCVDDDDSDDEEEGASQAETGEVRCRSLLVHEGGLVRLLVCDLHACPAPLPSVASLPLCDAGRRRVPVLR